PPGDRPLRLQPGSRAEMPPIVIKETREVASLTPERRAAYWRGNLRLIAVLLLAWFGCSYLPALLAPWLNQVVIFTGFPLGYYMGAQGAPLVFLALTLVYTWAMARHDRRFGGGARQVDRELRAQFAHRLGSFALLLIAATALLVLLELRFGLSATIIS